MAKKRKARSDAEKAADFKKLGTVRASRAVNALDGLAKLANRRRYGFTPAQVKTLADTLRASLDRCLGAFDMALKAPEGAQKATARIEL